jgi:hypothetical protein
MPTLCAVYMPVCPEKRKATKQPMNIYIAPSEPNNSIPMIKHAIGVLVAPLNTEMKPIAARNGTEI